MFFITFYPLQIRKYLEKDDVEMSENKTFFFYLSFVSLILGLILGAKR